MSLQSFDESRFRTQVSATLSKLQTILDNTRAPQYPADVPHVYDDKYGLVEFLANTSIAAGHECLAQLGVSAPIMAQLVGWARDRSVTLRFEGEEKCTYLRETTREVESPKVVTESSLFGKSSTKVVTKIVEHHWQFNASWQLSAFVGTGSGAGERVQLLSCAGACEIMNSHKESPPRVASRVVSPIDVRITWLLERTTAEMLPRFTIERASKACRTPRRNPQTEEAISFWRDFFAWTKRVYGYLLNELAPIHANHGLDTRAISDEQLFVPVAALFEQGKKGAPIAQHLKALPDPKAPKLLQAGDGDEKEEEPAAASAAGSVVPAAVGSSLLPVGDVNRFLSEQRRSLAAKTAELSKVFPTREAGKLLTQVEAGVLVVMLHVQRLGQSFADGVDYIELMLRRQLIAAVGKELTPLDFANYMRFHNRKLYRAGFEPRPFCYAIRRPAHYPEGTLSIEAVTRGEVAGQNAEPIVSHVRQVAPTWPMKFALNAATNVTFRGERYLHGYISQQFSGGGAASLSLTARARQFSSFLVLVGTLGGAELFQPKHAILVQNKDELTIPLNLETIPSAGEFRDAIESLSPEQQRFAKAIRSMQLEGSMFGVLIIQIKPQLEKLLRLPFDSLTKEIQLTQDLMELFVKYSIPSDQLSYSGEESASQETKLAQVQRQVDRFHKLVQETKDKELAERVQEAQYNVADEVANCEMMRCEEQVECLKRDEPSPPMKRMMKMKKGGAPVSRASSAAAAPALSARSSSIAPPKPSAAAAAPSKPAASSAPPQQQPQQQQQAQASGEQFVVVGEDDEVPGLDWTALPVALDAKLLELDEEAALRPTIITAGSTWTKRSQKSLLAPPSTATLSAEEQDRARTEAFDLLDALSRSGSLAIDCAELHVVMACTHNFTKTLIDTVVQDNVNPIERVEKSSLLLATTVHDKLPSELVKPEQRERIATYAARNLFIDEQKQMREQRALPAGEQ